MITITISGESLEAMAKEAMHFAEVILNKEVEPNPSKEETVSAEEVLNEPHTSYRPPGVNRPESRFSPVDDGTEWNDEAVADWLKRLNHEGRKVVRLLAEKEIIDPRKEAEGLKLPGPSWAGIWTGPRRKASEVMRLRGLKSWPYGHTYYEPRRLWMHPDIAQRVKSANH